VRAQVAAIAGGTLPPDIASAATALDAKLATFGGATGRGGRGGGGGGGGAGRGGRGGPAGVTSFTALNGTFYSLVALQQNGMDMAPTKAQIDTWQATCKDYSATMVAWKTMQGVDLASFNAMLAKNNLPPLKITPTALVAPASCAFVPPAPRAAGGGPRPLPAPDRSR